MASARRARGVRLGNTTPRLFVVSSPSGGGKTTVVGALLRQRPTLTRSRSVTTRVPRGAERRGRAYRFVSRKEFERLRATGQLLEWAKVHEAYYGTPKAPITRALARGRDVVLCIDVQGARQVRRRLGRNAVLVFLVPPSLQVLKARLIRRGTEAPAAMRTRLAVAKREMASVGWYDYTVVNRRIEEAVAQLKAIMVAERLRVPHGARRNRA